MGANHNRLSTLRLTSRAWRFIDCTMRLDITLVVFQLKWCQCVVWVYVRCWPQMVKKYVQPAQMRDLRRATVRTRLRLLRTWVQHLGAPKKAVKGIRMENVMPVALEYSTVQYSKSLYCSLHQGLCIYLRCPASVSCCLERTLPSAISGARDNVVIYDKLAVWAANWFLALFLSPQTPSHNNRTTDNVHQNYCRPRPRGASGRPNVWA
jgi:hypothetical protein